MTDVIASGPLRLARLLMYLTVFMKGCVIPVIDKISGSQHHVVVYDSEKNSCEETALTMSANVLRLFYLHGLFQCEEICCDKHALSKLCTPQTVYTTVKQ